MPQEPYRCERCLSTVKRCAECRARRQAAKLERQAAKRAAGICIDCASKAKRGLVRCAKHTALNNRLSGAAHAKRRS